MKSLFLNFKTRVVVSLVFLLAIVSLLSCEKSKQLDGTSWNCNKLESISYEYQDPYTGKDVTAKIDIAFVKLTFGKEDADIAVQTFQKRSFGSTPVMVRGKAAYTHEKEKIVLSIDWDTATMFWAIASMLQT
jgi:hypothetical protein